MQTRTVLCLGDWMSKAQAAWRSRGLSFIRCGVNGDMSLSIARRLQKELQRHPKPDGIILLAGSNDVMACTGSDFHWLHVHLKRQLTGQWSKQQYIDQMTSMLDSVAQASPECAVAVLTIPPLGEQLDSYMNQQVAAFNTSLAAAVSGRHNVTLLDLHKACVQHLVLAQRGRAPPAADVTLWRGAWTAFLALTQHYVLRWSWDGVSRWHGLQLLTDHVHLNDTAGELLLLELEPWLQRLATKSATLSIQR